MEQAYNPSILEAKQKDYRSEASLTTQYRPHLKKKKKKQTKPEY